MFYAIGINHPMIYTDCIKLPIWTRNFKSSFLKTLRCDYIEIQRSVQLTSELSPRQVRIPAKSIKLISKLLNVITVRWPGRPAGSVGLTTNIWLHYQIVICKTSCEEDIEPSSNRCVTNRIELSGIINVDLIIPSVVAK